MKNHDDYFKRLERRIGMFEKGNGGLMPLSHLNENVSDYLLAEWEKPKKTQQNKWKSRLKSALKYKMTDVVNIVFGLIVAICMGWSVQTSVEGVFQSAFFVSFLFYICAGLFVIIKVGSTNRLAGWTIFVPFLLFVSLFYVMRPFIYPNFLGGYFNFILIYLLISIGVLFENKTLENGMLVQKEAPSIVMHRKGFSGVIFFVFFGLISACGRCIRFFLPYWAIGILFAGVGFFFLGYILKETLFVTQNAVQSWYMLLMVGVLGLSQFMALKKAWQQDKVENLIGAIVDPLGICLKFILLSVWVENYDAFPQNILGMMIVYVVLFWPIQMRYLCPFLDDFVPAQDKTSSAEIQNEKNLNNPLTS